MVHEERRNGAGEAVRRDGRAAAWPLLLLAAIAGSMGEGGARAATPRAEPRGRMAEEVMIPQPAVDKARAALVKQHGGAEAPRVDQGLAQVRRFWRMDQDGDAAAFEAFVTAEFIPRGAALDGTFVRLETALEQVSGSFVSLGRELRSGVDLDVLPPLPIDMRLADYDPGAHFLDDMFDGKLAFVVLLNFPLTTLKERLAEGPSWTRRQWAEARLAQRFGTRVPATVSRRINTAYLEADAYISGYNIRMHHLLTEKGERPFPAGLRLISHWGLRDELKARYADPQGLARQRLIQTVMERIVTQEIPAAVIDNPRVDWTPATNAVTAAPEAGEAPAAGGGPAGPEREADERYRRWKAVFDAVRLADPYDPQNPTFIDRRFNVDREIPEPEVRALLESVLQSPLGGEVARLIRARLGRDLEPFDVWYAGFRPRGRYEEAELDAITRKRYPDAAAYASDIPRLLGALGFSPEKARFLADHIVVDPSRGAGHALGAARRDDKAHLRTRVGSGGMDYKGYNIAVHEMGHNVEQVFSLNLIDHTLLQGVPNTAFTEAMAFLFQARDLELLGLEAPSADADRLRVLDTFWATREIAGVALVDMAAWHWLYDHPDATPAAFRQAVVGIARDVWNRHYAPLLGARDVPLLAIYSHLVSNGLYTPDYPLGHLIAFQVGEHFRKKGDFGAEFERLCRIGSITPDAWLREGLGGPLSAAPLLEAVRHALADAGV